MDKRRIEECESSYKEARLIWDEQTSQFREGMEDTIKEILEGINLKRVDLSDYDGIDLTVCWDGGHHPDYASTMFSTVYSIYLKDGEVLLSTEDCVGYKLKYLLVQEVADVLDALFEVLHYDE